MRFETEEVVFYIVIYGVGSFSAQCRIWYDGLNIRIGRRVGRALSGGLWAVGIIGVYIGNDPSVVVSPFPFVAMAALIGIVAADLQDKFLYKILKHGLQRLGFIGKDSEDS